MMQYNITSPEQSLRRLALKYGAAAAIMIVNYTVISNVLVVVLYTMIGLTPYARTLTDYSTDAGYLVIMLLNEVASYAVLIAVYAAVFRNELAEKHGIPSFTDRSLTRYPGETIILYIVGMTAATTGSLLTNIISSWLHRLLNIPEVRAAFSGTMPTNGFKYAVFEICTCIIAPICEEMIYRYFLLKPLRKYGDTSAALITAFMFALSHFNFDQFLYTFLFGYFLAVIAIRCNSVVPAIICHVVNNVTAGIETYLPETFGNETIDRIFAGISGFLANLTVPLYIAGFGFAVLAIVLRLLRLDNASGIPLRRQLSVIFTHPLFLISVLFILVITFLNLY